MAALHAVATELDLRPFLGKHCDMVAVEVAARDVDIVALVPDVQPDVVVRKQAVAYPVNPTVCEKQRSR